MTSITPGQQLEIPLLIMQCTYSTRELRPIPARYPSMGWKWRCVLF